MCENIIKNDVLTFCIIACIVCTMMTTEQAHPVAPKPSSTDVAFTSLAKVVVDRPALGSSLGEVVANADAIINKLRTMDKPTPMDTAILLGDKKQIAALTSFNEGKMTYAEMRGMCG